MSDLISREQAIAVLKPIPGVGWKAIHALEDLPPALTKGKWIVYEVANDEEEHPIAWECDACGAVVDCKTRFCPECGQEKEV